VIPPPRGMLSVADRLAFALKCNLLALVPLVLILTRRADGRFRSDAINLLAPRETRGGRGIRAGPPPILVWLSQRSPVPRARDGRHPNPELRDPGYRVRPDGALM